MNKSQIREIHKKFQVPENIIAHMEKVAEFSDKLAIIYVEKGYKINRKNIIQAALLHDVLKFIDFPEFHPDTPETIIKTWESIKSRYHGMNHAEAMSKYLTEIEEPELARLVRVHDFIEIEKLQTLEEKILYYSDKRVQGDQIVTLKKRLLHGRVNSFHKGRKRLDIEAKIYKLEKEIKSEIGQDLSL